MKRLSWISLLFILLISTSFAQVERTHDIVPEDYFTQIFLSGVEASPDGKLTAFVDYRWDLENDRRSRDLWVLNNKTKETLRLTFDPGNETSPAWSPDSNHIIFTFATTSGIQFRALCAATRKTCATTGSRC